MELQEMPSGVAGYSPVQSVINQAKGELSNADRQVSGEVDRHTWELSNLASENYKIRQRLDSNEARAKIVEDYMQKINRIYTDPFMTPEVKVIAVQAYNKGMEDDLNVLN